MGNKLQGRSAVVTGAGRGIGREIALALAAEGANVVVADPGVSKSGAGTDATPAAEVVAEIKKMGGNAVASQESVSDFAAAGRIIKTCIDTFGKIDILVNCAGILRDRTIHKMAEEEWDAVMAVHLKGCFNMCRHAVPFMRDQQYGRIINITSDAWRGVTVGQANYGAAKGGIVSFTRALALELGSFGITCNCVAPQAATRMTMDEDTKIAWKKMMEAGKITPEQYEGAMDMPGPEFVAPVVAYLATEAAGDINKQVIGAGGGRVALYCEPVEIRGLYRDHKKEGKWTVDELINMVPKTLLVGYVNPAPPAKPAK